MKILTIEEFIKFCRNNPDRYFSEWDYNTDIYQYTRLWRDALAANSQPCILLKTENCFRLYDSLVKLFGTDIDKDLQQFFDDNKDQLIPN